MFMLYFHISKNYLLHFISNIFDFLYNKLVFCNKFCVLCLYRKENGNREGLAIFGGHFSQQNREAWPENYSRAKWFHGYFIHAIAVNCFSIAGQRKHFHNCILTVNCSLIGKILNSGNLFKLKYKIVILRLGT